MTVTLLLINDFEPSLKASVDLLSLISPLVYSIVFAGLPSSIIDQSIILMASDESYESLEMASLLPLSRLPPLPLVHHLLHYQKLSSTKFTSSMLKYNTLNCIEYGITNSNSLMN